MRPVLRPALVIAAAGVTLSACSDQSGHNATAPTFPQRVSAAVLPLSCDFTTLKSNARNYAASNKDALITIVGDLQSLSRKGPNAQATDKAFDGLSRLAAMRGTSAQNSAATGALFNATTLGFIGCMESYIAGTVPDNFSVAGALGSGWLYEVRGKSSDSPDGAYERGAAAAYWAAEAPGGWAPATSSQATRFLIYGFRLVDFLPNDPKVGTGFELRTVPQIGSGLTLGSPLSIGVCNVDETPTMRVQHINTILPNKELTCASPPGFALGDATGPAAVFAFARRAVDFFAVKPAHATMFFGIVGGAVSELSPSVVIDMQSVQLALVDPIADGRISRPLADTNDVALQVRVTTQNGTPLPNVAVTIGIAGNSSSIAYFKEGNNGPDVPTVTRTTNASGIATFDNPDVFLVKAGGYQLVATGGFDGVNGAPFLSNSFNIQNK
jgi:hypothetical protein